jgi:hypothetical protein
MWSHCWYFIWKLIFAGEGLTDEEIVKVGGIITANCNKIDYFFILLCVQLASKEALVM